MKTKAKQTDKNTKKKASPGRASSGRGLNTDEQNRVTNSPVGEEEDENRSEFEPTEDVEKEEDRERKRRVEDEQGE